MKAACKLGVLLDIMLAYFVVIIMFENIITYKDYIYRIDISSHNRTIRSKLIKWRFELI